MYLYIIEYCHRIFLTTLLINIKLEFSLSFPLTFGRRGEGIELGLVFIFPVGLGLKIEEPRLKY